MFVAKEISSMLYVARLDIADVISFFLGANNVCFFLKISNWYSSKAIFSFNLAISLSTNELLIRYISSEVLLKKPNMFVNVQP